MSLRLASFTVAASLLVWGFSYFTSEPQSDRDEAERRRKEEQLRLAKERDVEQRRLARQRQLEVYEQVRLAKAREAEHRRQVEAVAEQRVPARRRQTTQVADSEQRAVRDRLAAQLELGQSDAANVFSVNMRDDGIRITALGTEGNVHIPTPRQRFQDDGIRVAPLDTSFDIEVGDKGVGDGDNGIRVVPVTDYRDDDGIRVSAIVLPGETQRAQAAAAAKLRDDFFRRSRLARDAGRISEAKTLSLACTKYKDEVKAYNNEAARLIFAHFNPQYNSSSSATLKTCDLHRLFVSEAEHHVKEHIHACRRTGTQRTRFITGRGRGSKGGESILTPAVIRSVEGMTGVAVVEEDGEIGVGSVLVVIDALDVDDLS